MIRNWMICFLLLLPVMAHAQKLYKVVDEDGNVSFSQYPPSTTEEKSTVESMSVSSGSQSVVREELGGLYCGSIRLPEPGSAGLGSTSHTKSLDRQLGQWRDQMHDVSQRIDKSNSAALEDAKRRSAYSRNNSQYQNQKVKSYRQNVDKNSEKLRDLRCAIGWAEEQLENSHEIVTEESQERDRLLGIRKELELTIASRCGELPAYDPRHQKNEYERKEWYDCSSYLRKEIKQINTKISKL